MEFNCTAAPERFVAVARALGEPVDGCSTLDAEPCGAIVRPAPRRRHRDPERAVGMWSRASATSIEVVEEAMKSGNVTVNPRRTSKEQLAEILRCALQNS